MSTAGNCSLSNDRSANGDAAPPVPESELTVIKDNINFIDGKLLCGGRGVSCPEEAEYCLSCLVLRYEQGFRIEGSCGINIYIVVAGRREKIRGPGLNGELDFLKTANVRCVYVPAAEDSTLTVPVE